MCCAARSGPELFTCTPMTDGNILPFSPTLLLKALIIIRRNNTFFTRGQGQGARTKEYHLAHEEAPFIGVVLHERQQLSSTCGEPPSPACTWDAPVLGRAAAATQLLLQASSRAGKIEFCHP